MKSQPNYTVVNIVVVVDVVNIVFVVLIFVAVHIWFSYCQ